MPLSEHDKKVIAEMEESLTRHDPHFAKSLRDTNVYSHGMRRVKWGVLGFVVGLALLVAFFTTYLLVALVGVAVMFASAVVVERSARRLGRAGWRDLTRPGGEEGPGWRSRLGGRRPQ
ncbi:MAG: DUF3040 domain-containing protein [Acidimicrobiaceae bacterium]|nr:DUF3040 domain-containing protein [Acidimicrobiaceae bacterium]